LCARIVSLERSQRELSDAYSYYANLAAKLEVRIAALESALQTIADTHGPGTLAGDAAREGMKR